MSTGQQFTAIERAAFMYAERGASLAVVLEAYLRNPLGYVIKRPDFFLLARPCQLADADRWLASEETPDAWYVQMLVGASIGNALREMPYLLPHCCWQREMRGDLRLHVCRTDFLFRLNPPTSTRENRSPSARAA